MSKEETTRILELQQRLLERFEELGFADYASASKVSRHLSEIAVLGRQFAEHTLPLFLELDRDNQNALAQISLAIKCDLEELADAVNDVAPLLPDVVEFLRRQP